MVESSSLYIEAVCVNADGMKLSVFSSFDGNPTGSCECTIIGNYTALVLKLDVLHLWNVGEPNLYDIKITMGEDSIVSYFGMREISFKNRGIHINGRPVFQRMILDQGFYPDGIITAPSEEELIADITRSIDMGFNGARLHQKVFEPVFHYHCDRLGYITWGESASWGIDWLSDSVWPGFIPEWLEILERDYNHPSIIGWCPFNELMQIGRNALFFYKLYQLTKMFDPTRLFIEASGYHHVISDLLDIHDGDTDVARFKARYDVIQEGKSAVHPKLGEYGPELCFISEFGGMLWNPDGDPGWGYGETPKTEEEFIDRYRGLIDAILDNSKLSGFCYIQLTDIEQEKNGLYYYNRIPKFDPKIINKINTKISAWEKTLI